MAYFAKTAEIDMVHVPYKGTAEAVTDVSGGRGNAVIVPTAGVGVYLQDTRLRVIGITAKKRSPLLPNVPSLEELGIKEANVYSWQAVAAPKGLPSDIKAKLHAAIVSALNDPQVKPKLLELGFEIVANSPEQFSAYQASEFARWKSLIQSRNIKAD